jgi:hypothetical protein
MLSLYAERAVYHTCMWHPTCHHDQRYTTVVLLKYVLLLERHALESHICVDASKTHERVGMWFHLEAIARGRRSPRLLLSRMRCLGCRCEQRRTPPPRAWRRRWRPRSGSCCSTGPAHSEPRCGPLQLSLELVAWCTAQSVALAAEELLRLLDRTGAQRTQACAPHAHARSAAQ